MDHRGGGGEYKRNKGRGCPSAGLVGPPPDGQTPLQLSDHVGRVDVYELLCLVPRVRSPSVPGTESRTVVPLDPGPHGGRVFRRGPTTFPFGEGLDLH